MVKITKVYTKTGDKGMTHLAGSHRVSKMHPRVEVFNNGSIMTWQHINMHGEYDFTAYFANNDSQFDLNAIQQLEVG